jgi:antitoxin component YwqK of YwqJK toxin-antitoxin module
MIRLDKQMFSFNKYYKAIAIFLVFVNFYSCSAQPSTDKLKLVNTGSKVAPESLHFAAHIVEQSNDDTKLEIDTLTGYRKYWYKNGKLQMEGKVTKGSTNDYRDGIWKYYNDAGQLMNQETYSNEVKIDQREFMYFTNGKAMSETFQYYEGDYRDKATFKFHKVEKIFYTNGQALSEKHWINGEVIDVKCWDQKGNPRPIEYLNTVKSVGVDE